jgi:hypothetical protein
MARQWAGSKANPGIRMHTISKLTLPRAVLLAALVLPAWACAQGAATVTPPAVKAGDFRGFSGVRWPTDFEVRSGHCDRARITENPRHSDAVASLGQRRALNRTAAMLVGAHVSDLLPARLGAEVDEGDRACMGQVLELGASGRWVRWDNGATGIHYEMRPDAGRDGIAGACRAFRLKAAGNDQHVKHRALACESGPGLWQLSGL